MNLELFGTVAEIIGALAVVATLGYLAMQIRDSNRVAADTNRQTRAAGVREMMMAMATDEKLRVTWIKALGGDEIYQGVATSLGLTNDEASIVDMSYLFWIWLHWGQYNSTMTEFDKVELQAMIKNFYSQEPLRTCLKKSPYNYTLDPEFLQFINDSISAEA